MKLNFPNWGYLHYALIKNAKEVQSLKHIDDIFAIKQFKLLDQEMKDNTNPITICNKILSKQYNEDKEFQKFVTTNSNWTTNMILAPNEFTTTYDVFQEKLIHVDPKVEKILDIKKENFTIESILGLNPQHPYFHPCDVLNFIRIAHIAYLLLSIKGISYSTKHDYFQISFRIKKPLKNSNDFTDIYIVKKSYILSNKSEHQGMFKQNLDVWSVNDSHEGNINHQFVTFGDDSKSKLLTSLSVLYNARLLSFTPKEILLINVFSSTERATDLRQKINSIIYDVHNIENFFSPKQISDQLYRLRQKLAQTYLDNCVLTEKEKKHIEIPTFSRCSNHLGLIDKNQIIITSIVNLMEIETEIFD